MRISVLFPAFVALIGAFFAPLAVAHASPQSADSVYFCQTVDPEGWGVAPARGSAAKRSAALNAGEPRTVRLFYFLPSDRPYRADVVAAMKTDILKIQTFFAEQMLAHGHGDRTFRIETDGRDDPIVHRVDGQHPERSYRSGFTQGEIAQAFDNSENIILIFMDVSSSRVGGRATYAGKRGGGMAIVYKEWSWFSAAHELGHAFGLHHDFRDNVYIMSYGGPLGRGSTAWLSACAAGYLAVQPYFNSNVPVEDGTPPTIERTSSGEYLAGAGSVPVGLRVRDADGLHQVILFAVNEDPSVRGFGDIEVKACRGLAGETDTGVEFNYDGDIPSDYDRSSLSDAPLHTIRVVAVDKAGNTSETPLTLAETSTHQIVALSGHTGPVRSVAFSHDGTILASGASDSTVRLWDVATDSIIDTLSEHTGAVNAVAFSPDSTIIASGSSDQSVKLWDGKTGDVIATIMEPIDVIQSVAFSPDGTTIAFGTSDAPRRIGERVVRLWDVATRSVAATLSHDYSVYAAAFSPDGTILASIGSSRTLRLWDVETRTNVTSLEEVGEYPISYSTDGTTLAMAEWDRNSDVKLWAVGTRTKIGTLSGPAQSRVRSVAFSPDGAVLASGHSDGTILLWNVAPRTVVASLTGHTSAVGSVVFSPDGTTLASGASDNTVRLWKVPGAASGVEKIDLIGDRTPQVRDAIVAAVPSVDSAAAVTGAHLAAITYLDLRDKSITSLKVGDFSGLSLSVLNLRNNRLSTLPSGVFDALSGLTHLYLDNNRLSALPSGFFSDLPSLLFLYLSNNQFSTLPAGFFEGLPTGLAGLDLTGNPQNNPVSLSLTVSLEKVGEGQFKATVAAGAPFDVALPVNVTNGRIRVRDAVTTTLTIPAGKVESTPLAVARTPGTTGPVTVDVGALPRLPRRDHRGYNLVKSGNLPVEIVSVGGNGPVAAATDFNGDGRTDFADFFLFADAYGGTNAKFDLDGSGTVDFADFFRFVDAFGS